MRHTTEDTVTQAAAVARHAGASDARLREVMSSLVRQRHGFASGVTLTETAWFEAVRQPAEAALAGPCHVDAAPTFERGVFRSGTEGGFDDRSIGAEPGPRRCNGPAGRLPQAQGRHPWRPTELHFMISAPRRESSTTSVFVQGGRGVNGDALFGIRRSLIADGAQHEPGRAPEGATSAMPFHTLDFDFVLA